ncbi:MAG: Clp protease ClpP [Chloroflexi bacterium]|nr:Clp protease ClpP [Chloroflexota bacterium]
MFEAIAGRSLIRAYGEVGFAEGGFTAEQFMGGLDEMGGDDITIRLQSEGGDIFTGMSIYNQILDYPGQVTVEIDSLSASIASVLMMAADQRIANANSRVMIHNPWTVAAGEASDFRGTADILDKFAADIADTYAEHTGKSSAFWRDVMDRSEYFSAEEAKGLGLVDKVAGRSTKAAAKAEPLVAMRPAYASYKASQQSRRLRIKRLTGDG